MKRMAIPSSAVLLFTMMFASPVLAAPPANDVYPGRIVIGGIPFTTTQDTTEATTDAVDAEMNPDECGAPATEASVWYELTGTDQQLLVDVSASDYSAGVLVSTGSPGSFTFVACQAGAVSFFAESGTTYAILLIDDQFDGGGNGGNLVLTIDEVPPPPEVDVEVDPIGAFDPQTGSATISGTITCDADAFAFLDASASQRVGRFVVRGFGFVELVCDGSEQSWTMEIFGDTGQFKGGKVQVQVFAQACTFECGFDEATATVSLRR